jgi:hypothetical protein
MNAASVAVDVPNRRVSASTVIEMVDVVLSEVVDSCPSLSDDDDGDSRDAQQEEEYEEDIMIPLKGCDDDENDDENEQNHKLEEMRASFRTKNRFPSIPRSLLLAAARGDPLVAMRASGQADFDDSVDLKSMHKQELLKDNMMCLQMALQATSLRETNARRPRPAEGRQHRYDAAAANTADAAAVVVPDENDDGHHHVGDDDEQMSDFDHTDYEDELDGDNDDFEDEKLPARLCDILLRSTYQSVASRSAGRVGEDGLPVDSSPLSSCQVRDFYRRYGGR